MYQEKSDQFARFMSDSGSDALMRIFSLIRKRNKRLQENMKFEYNPEAGNEKLKPKAGSDLLAADDDWHNYHSTYSSGYFY